MFTQKRMFIVSIVSAIVLVLEAGSSLSNTAQALPLIHVGELNGVTLPYAGSLTNDAGQPVADGAFDFIFMLYATPTDGEALWSETQHGVTVRVGSFTTLLGSF